DRGLQVEVRPSGTDKSPLSNIPEFVKTTCPRCGGAAERETDTMDTFVDSAWYFLRFVSPKLEAAAFDKAEAARWLPVDQYIGGAEHATKHLIYARFITKFLRDQGHVPFDEPFTNLFSQGLICKRDAKGELQKMSKSKGNVVNPDELIEKFGADTERLYTLFIGPPERPAEWQDDGIMGAYRFLNRVWTLVHEAAPMLPASGMAAPPVVSGAGAGTGTLSPGGIELRRKRHETVGEVSRDIDGKFGFNTAISSIMELVNTAKATTPATEGDRFVMRDALEAVTILLAPMVPHVAEELWRVLGHDVPTIFREKWPAHDPELAKRAEIEIAIQVNGKVRGREVVPRDVPEDEVKKVVLANERVKGYIDGKTVAKVIIVPNKLVNIVVK
ncbi:MAG TPA: class I tRNA ligase family protein, partial [Planctomycetota bacterium]|nr:class I tRNA ligase family protein [Planctomycetota bacterium]